MPKHPPKVSAGRGVRIMDMRDSSIPHPPVADGDWAPVDLALNHAAHVHAESVSRMQAAGAQLAGHVRHAVRVQRLSVDRVADLTGLEQQLVADLVGERS
jgi:hypothetical protein